MRIMNIAMMRNSSMLEFLCPPIRDSGMCRCGVSAVHVVSVRVLNFLAHDSPHSLCLVFSQGMLHCRNDRDGGVLFLRLKSSANGVVESAAGLQ